MHVTIRHPGKHVTEPMRDYLQRRAWFALGRRQSLIESVQVFLSDPNGPRGGLDWQCRAVVHLRGGAKLVTEGLAGSFAEAVDDALERAGRSVVRHGERRRSSRRRSLSDLAIARAD